MKDFGSVSVNARSTGSRAKERRSSMRSNWKIFRAKRKTMMWSNKKTSMNNSRKNHMILMILTMTRQKWSSKNNFKSSRKNRGNSDPEFKWFAGTVRRRMFLYFWMTTKRNSAAISYRWWTSLMRTNLVWREYWGWCDLVWWNFYWVKV